MILSYVLAGALAVSAAPDSGAAASSATQASPCDLASTTPWLRRWFAAWELTSREILKLADAEPPEVVFFDSVCVFTTSEVAGAGGAVGDGPAIGGTQQRWWTAAHGDSIRVPNGSRLPIALMSYTDSDRRTGPFFVMAAPSYWARAGHGNEPGLTAVFLHEFAHTRQVPGLLPVIGPIDSTWAFPFPLDDDAVQKRFGSDSVYVASYKAERDLLYRAAEAKSREQARTLASRALAMMRSRHERWFRGEDAVFATLDATFLSMEGAGQWTGYAWLAHPKGGGLERAAAADRISGRRRWWSQDEGLGLFLVVDRLLPGWPSLVFGERSIGALELLERAVKAKAAAR